MSISKYLKLSILLVAFAGAQAVTASSDYAVEIADTQPGMLGSSYNPDAAAEQRLTNPGMLGSSEYGSDYDAEKAMTTPGMLGASEKKHHKNALKVVIEPSGKGYNLQVKAPTGKVLFAKKTKAVVVKVK